MKITLIKDTQRIKIKLMHRTSLVALLSIQVFGLYFHSFGQVPYDSKALKAKVLIEDDNRPVRDAIKAATAAGKSEVLVTAMDHPNWGVRCDALSAMTKLPTPEAALGVTAVLRKDTLWDSHVLGGPAMIAQDQFNDVLKALITKLLSVDASHLDLYNAATRAQLLTSLRDKFPEK